MSNTLFSTYSQGENRVTATILAVFERISFTLVERILQQLCQESQSDLLEFQNQPKGITSVPDAVIRASFAYWIETKIVPDTIRKQQIEGHLQALSQTGVDHQMLLILSPDASQPAVLDEINDDRIAWANFDTLVEVLSGLVTKDEAWFVSDEPMPTEREQELLRELVRFLISENLLGAGEQVLVVPARHALQEYLDHSVYICQPNRTFQPSSHLAFYAHGKIHRQIPRILGQIEEVVLDPDAITERSDLPVEQREQLAKIAKQIHRPGPIRRDANKVIFLTAPDSPDTLQLPADIVNDLASRTGRTVAFVQGQRYIPVARLMSTPSPTRTSELVD